MKSYYFPEPSMRSYETGLWHLESSSRMVRFRAVVNHLSSKYEWIWAVPGANLSKESLSVVPVDVTPLPMPWERNVGDNRWQFPVDLVSKAFKQVKPELIVTECVEHVVPIKLAMKRAEVTAPVVANIGYVPLTGGFDSWPDPMIRQIEGFIHADAVAFNSEVERDAWFSNASWYTNPDILPKNHKRYVWNGLFEPDDCLCVKDEATAFKPAGPPIIFYTGRMSDDDRTHWASLVGALEQVNKKRDFITWVGNPNEAKSWKEIKKLFANYTPHPYGEEPLTREQYLKLLWAADIVPILIPNRTSGFCEAGYTNNTIICADSIGPKANEIISIDQTFSTDELAEYVDKALDIAEQDWVKLKMRWRRQQRWIGKEHAVHKNMKPFEETLEAVIG